VSTAPASSESAGPQPLLERAIAVIEAVVDAGAPVGPRGLARIVGIDRSAVGRILQQMTELGIFEKGPDGYVAGPRLFGIARLLASLDTLPDAARNVLDDLVARYNETSYVSVLHGDSAVFLYESPSSNPLRFVVELGRPVPLHAGGAGRAILAGLPPETARQLLGPGPLESLTASTVVAIDELLDLAAADRARGYSVSIGERVEGGAAIGAPFFDHSGECQGSVVFTTPLSRLDRTMLDELGTAVAAAATTLSARLGFK
jgi:DNA-binding IclR family transcriptional regulator